MASGYTNIYECPDGCKSQGGKPIAATIRGWKKHMTRQHGGYTEEQLAAILSTNAPDTEKGRDLFLNEIDSASSVDAESASSPAETGDAANPSPVPPVPLKTDATAKKFRAEMTKMKEQISSGVCDAINIKLKDSPEWQLEKEESEAVAESIQNALKILDIELAVQPIQWTFTSPFWVLLMPLLTLIIIFGKKAAKNGPSEKTEEKSK